MTAVPDAGQPHPVGAAGRATDVVHEAGKVLREDLQLVSLGAVGVEPQPAAGPTVGFVRPRHTWRGAWYRAPRVLQLREHCYVWRRHVPVSLSLSAMIIRRPCFERARSCKPIAFCHEN